ncbi:MdlB ABC transporter ATPase/permease component [Encephalitozoon intestinalis ATCC 50506]|uniref:MdlB ABC transporter ATPase/permease component n=1 Tax=Encephalitozoon intestinalis (strain ATCC 50506) TaxID=876142 RepID=E0S6J7_ENCIT|nr:MdlB ABC transporter ATPase/permease component [Encephalitozoon intestinalis ATCC 50506]ADM11332.1 MdlB ABC transporter ATPase/permease component [Encephalitozoon intestinalis ATCC 50506]UTX45019.1 ABC transporter protein [Encephalitozoon intestinalis]
MKEVMKRSSKLSAVRDILFKYILGSPVVRVIILPVIAILLVAGYGEIFITEILNEIQEKADETEAVNGKIKVYLAVALSSYVFGFVSLFVMSSYIETICRDYIIDLYREHISMSFLDFKKIGVGDMISFMNRKVLSLRDVLESIIKCFIMSLFCVLITVIKIRSGIENRYGLLMAGVVIVYGVCVIVLNHYRNIIRLKMNKEIDLSNRKIYNSILNYDIIKSYNNEELEANELYKCMKGQTKYAKIYWSWLQVGNFIGENMFVIAMFIMTVRFSNGDTKNIGFRDYTLIFSLSNQLRMYCVDISNSFGMILLNLTNIAQNRSEPSREDIQEIGYYKENLEREIKIEGLEISIEGKKLIRNVSMCIRKGEKIGISGDNGGGKTSFARALLGFLDYSGSIQIDGMELNGLSKEGLRKMIAYSPQESQLFNKSVIGNIRDGNSRLSDEEIVEFCKRYELDGVFKNLDGGYQTLVGNGGNRLSGGQKQKVSMMRTVVKDASIYIFDQVTSHMDKESENRLVDMIMKNLSDKTIIMIMRNSDLLNKFDKVYHFSDGVLFS